MDTAPIDRLFDALAAGDITAARGCFLPDARVWHSYDAKAMSVDEAATGWEGLTTNFTERSFEDVQQEALAGGGVLRRHIMAARRKDGTRMAWPICMVVQVKDGLIARFDEYIDRAGSLSVADGPVRTPGLG